VPKSAIGFVAEAEPAIQGTTMPRTSRRVSFCIWVGRAVVTSWQFSPGDSMDTIADYCVSRYGSCGAIGPCWVASALSHSMI